MSHKKSEKKEKEESAAQAAGVEKKEGGTVGGARKSGIFGGAGNEVSEPNAVAPRLEELKAALVKGNVLFGSRSVLKSLKLKNPKTVFVASNCPETVRNDIGSHAKISGATVENFAGTAKHLGIVCGKPFAIASLAVLPEQKKK